MSGKTVMTFGIVHCIVGVSTVERCPLIKRGSTVFKWLQSDTETLPSVRKRQNKLHIW